MERRIMRTIRTTAFVGAFFATLFLASSCDNSVNLLSKLETEVMKSNDRFLKVASIYIPLQNNLFSPTGTIEVVFDRPIDPSSLSNDTLLVQTATGVKQTYDMSRVDYIASANTVRVRFDPYLPVNQDMQITVSGIRGADGAKMHETMHKSFRTQAMFLGSISNVKGGNSNKYDFSTTTSFTFDISVNGYNPYFKYEITINDKTISYPINSFANSTDYSTPKKATLNLADFDISEIDGAYPVHILFKGSDKGSGSDVSDGNFASFIANIDTTAPTPGNIALSTSSPTNSTSVSFNFSTQPEDSGSGVYQVAFSNNATDWSSWQIYVNETISFDITTGAGGSSTNGQRTIYAKIIDYTGHESDIISADFIYDNAPPQGGSWKINNGEPTVFQNRNIIISSTAMPVDATSSVTHIRFGNTTTSSTEWGPWEAFVSSKNWELVSGPDGNRTIEIEVQDSAGNVSTPVELIVLYTDSPQSGVSSPIIHQDDDTGILNTDSITNKTTLRLIGTADPNSTVTLLRGSHTNPTGGIEAGSITIGANTSWEITLSGLTEGEHSFFTKGEMTGQEPSYSPSTLNVTVDTTPPNPPSVSSESAPTNRRPTITWSSGGAGGNGIYTYQWNNGQETPSTKTSFKVDTELSNSSYSFSIKEADTAGNISDPASTTFTVNAAPNPPLFDVLESATLDTSFTWSWTSGRFGNGTYRYRLNSNKGSWKEVSDKSITLTSLSDGENTLYLQEKDDQGNWSESRYKRVIISPVLPYSGQILSILTTSVTLQWRAAVFSLSDYTIEKKVLLGWETIGTTGKTLREFKWNDLSTGSYTWRIRYSDSKMGYKYIPSENGATFTIKEEGKTIPPPKGLPKYKN